MNPVSTPNTTTLPAPMPSRLRRTIPVVANLVGTLAAVAGVDCLVSAAHDRTRAWLVPTGNALTATGLLTAATGWGATALDVKSTTRARLAIASVGSNAAATALTTGGIAVYQTGLNNHADAQQAGGLLLTAAGYALLVTNLQLGWTAAQRCRPDAHELGRTAASSFAVAAAVAGAWITSNSLHTGNRALHDVGVGLVVAGLSVFAALAAAPNAAVPVAVHVTDV